MPLSRREFLKGSIAGLGALCAAGLPRVLRGQEAGPAAKAATSAGAVYEFNEPKLLDDFGNVQENLVLRGSVHRILTQMTGTKKGIFAWKEFFSKEDIIGIKFQPISADVLRTSPAVARMLVESLVEGGFRAEKIVLLSPPPYTAALETTPALRGYLKDKVAAGKRETQFSRAAEQVTAILNVPSLMDHRLFGLSCGTVNMALDLISNPGEFFDPGGTPGLVDLVACDMIRKKHRLTIVNAIRGIYDGGPRAPREKVWNQCSILAGTDFVAVDRVAWDILDSARFGRGLQGLADSGREPTYLAEAARRGLGLADLGRIRRIRVSF
ncbi:MAG: DUF362 domain-containing protein [Planctomycetes bacterium]|nr:DUF362 domain-containing protein [Planctomycetota bacterium]